MLPAAGGLLAQLTTLGYMVPSAMVQPVQYASMLKGSESSSGGSGSCSTWWHPDTHTSLGLDAKPVVPYLLPQPPSNFIEVTSMPLQVRCMPAAVLSPCCSVASSI